MLAVRRLITSKGDLLKDELINEDEQTTCHLLFPDFEAASKRVKPTAKREGFSTIPDTNWADVGKLINSAKT